MLLLEMGSVDTIFLDQTSKPSQTSGGQRPEIPADKLAKRLRVTCPACGLRVTMGRLDGEWPWALGTLTFRGKGRAKGWSCTFVPSPMDEGGYIYARSTAMKLRAIAERIESTAEEWLRQQARGVIGKMKAAWHAAEMEIRRVAWQRRHTIKVKPAWTGPGFGSVPMARGASGRGASRPLETPRPDKSRSSSELGKAARLTWEN